MHPNAPLIKRSGPINAWDSPEFRAAVKATGKNQIILAAITTDVCATLLALSLVEEGYTVFHNAEASSAASERIAVNVNNRMGRAGVQIMSMMSVVSDLMRDYGTTPGARDSEVLPFFDEYATFVLCYVLIPDVSGHLDTGRLGDT
ncbi:hypothetical protein PM082_023469 [Marasmius tenuissimus]|nr:hypothetical protein PM082_023469 [Marasmius tenuissimus]